MCWMEKECRMNSKYVCWRQFSKEKKVEDAAVTYRGEKLLEYAMKVPERVMKRRNRLLINVDSMQLRFIPGRGTTNALFVVR